MVMIIITKLIILILVILNPFISHQIRIKARDTMMMRWDMRISFVKTYPLISSWSAILATGTFYRESMI